MKYLLALFLWLIVFLGKFIWNFDVILAFKEACKAFDDIINVNDTEDTEDTDYPDFPL